MKLFLVLIAIIAVGTGIPVALHYQEHGLISAIQALLSFFLCLNSLICLWEISLGLNITHIEETYKRLKKDYEKNRFAAVGDFMVHDMSIQEIFSLKFWSRIWSTYSLYDPSYSNRESFGFFVDVGNGWTTIIPSIIFLLSMTYHNSILSARVMGMVGLIKFYQEFYGTCIYFLSFFFNKRHVGKSLLEIGLFVGFSNGLWFVFPLLGMYVSVQMIQTDSYAIFL